MTLSFPVAPMKATMGSLPTGPGWAFEIKWDGHRTLAHVQDGSVRLQTTAGHDSSQRWPEVAALADSVNADQAILDGEMLVLDEDGRPSFDLVQRRDATLHPAVFHVFDVLQVDGTDVVDAEYTQRRSLLESLVEPGDHWAVPAHHTGDGSDLLAATAEKGLEGLIAKRVDSRYRPGTRTKDWVKVKHRVRVELTIGGFTTGSGNRANTFGSLLVGVEEAGRLRFAGGVGTGFSQATLEALTQELRARTIDECPFEPPPDRVISRTATWVQPVLRARLEIAEYTNIGHVRHASFVELIR